MAPLGWTRGRLSSATLDSLDDIVGARRDGPVRGPVSLGEQELPALSRGVYVVLDVDGRPAYVGKVCSARDRARLRSRIREHLQDPAKREAFDCVYFFPVQQRYGNAHVEQIEGWFAIHLRPHMSQRSPRVGGFWD